VKREFSYILVYDRLKSDSKTPWYFECTRFTLLSLILCLVNLNKEVINISLSRTFEGDATK